MNFSFHPEAEKEFNQAIDYYEDLQENLGLEFAQEIFDAIQRITKYPLAWQSMTSETRRCLTNRFPFGIIYQIVEKQIVVIAVMHLHKKPDYWKKR